MMVTTWGKVIAVFILFITDSVYPLTITNNYPSPIMISAWILKEGLRHEVIGQTTVGSKQQIEIPKRFDLSVPVYVKVMGAQKQDKTKIPTQTFLFYLDPGMNTPIPVESIRVWDANNAVFLAETGIGVYHSVEDNALPIPNPSTTTLDGSNKPTPTHDAVIQYYENKIQKESENQSEIDKLREKLSLMSLPDEVRIEVMRQFRRIDRTPRESPEYSIIQNYLEWVAALPFNKKTIDNNDLSAAKKTLDVDQYGMAKAKDKILDFLGAKIFRERQAFSRKELGKVRHRSPILCLVGPPGVGKTSLGKSIAACLGRKFQKISLSGIDDVAELLGHRKTYIEAMPGRIIHALRKAESSNPVILLDEIDKIGTGRGGNPHAALLEILDPDHNATFVDHYLGVAFDLSDVFFITTANNIESIPGPLLDRMEVIELPPYTLEEKVEITKKHLLPRTIKEMGLEGSGFVLDTPVITSLISQFAREAGVRRLEEHIRTLAKKHARAIIETQKGITFTVENLNQYLGARISSGNEEKIRKNRVGGANGLAWSSVGGAVIQIQACLVKGNGRLVLTGNLGETMKESAQAAITYARSQAQDLKIDQSLFTDYDIHIHLPAGGIPKDGPSAGITLCTAIVSLLTNRQFNAKYAMTGEIDLMGNVLPIGGVKEKVLAAIQNKLQNVLLPKDNFEDYKECEQDLKGINVIWVDNMKQVLDTVLLSNEPPKNRKIS